MDSQLNQSGSYEPRYEKNGLRGFCTGPTQTGLYNQRKMARGLKFRIEEEEVLYYQCSENKGADQLRGYREADLRLCFCIYKSRFSHNEAHICFGKILEMAPEVPQHYFSGP